MQANLPDRSEIMRAIEIYLATAYPDGLPVVVRSQLQLLKSWGGEFMKCPVLIPDPAAPKSRYSIRLGNASYPHMKLRLELAPDESEFLFRADSHDRHICPPSESPEHSAFCDLMDKNQKIVETIETEWEKAGFHTFKTYLREDLRKRRAQLSK